VGAIESITIDNASGMVLGEGRFLDVRGSSEAQAQTDAGVTGPSVDLFDDVNIVEVQKLIEAGVVGPDLTHNFDDLQYTVDDNNMIVITNARIAGATLVQIPAFADVSINLGDGDSDSPALMASAAPEELPPLEYFVKPESVTPVTVDGDRVYGYVATWNTCHVGLPGCTTAPSSNTGYAHFLRKPQKTTDGTVVPVGVLTVGGGHADPSLGMVPAMQHYDDVGSAVAKVFAAEDEHGIWVSGWVLPYADPVKVQQLSDLDVSGDWRQSGGNLEMIAVCAVNTPGFPVLRKVHFSLGKGGQQTLIGQFKVEPVTDTGGTDARAAWARSQWRGKD
jgi:hypothetical protein